MLTTSTFYRLSPESDSNGLADFLTRAVCDYAKRRVQRQIELHLNIFLRSETSLLFVRLLLDGLCLVLGTAVSGLLLWLNILCSGISRLGFAGLLMFLRWPIVLAICPELEC